MGRACCVLGCSSGGDVPSHLIPKNPVLFQKWKKQIYSSKLQHLTDEQISKRAVCYRHFAHDDYLVTFRARKLKRGIVPSLNLPNKSATDEPDINIDMKREIELRDKSINISAAELEANKTQETMMRERTDSALFKNISEKTKSCLFEQPTLEAILDNYVKRYNFTKKGFKLYYKKRILGRKRAKLTEEQLVLLQHRKQVEQYEKTPTIQKLLSTLTSTEVAYIKTRIQRSKYSPRICVKLYHDMAKRKALYQS